MKRKRYTAEENREFLDAIRAVLGLEPIPRGSTNRARRTETKAVAKAA
jgi:hypothetical protein